MNQYEAVFILNPVLSEDQIKEAVKKFEIFLSDKEQSLSTRKIGDLKNLLTQFKTKKVVFIIYLNLL